MLLGHISALLRASFTLLPAVSKLEWVLCTIGRQTRLCRSLGEWYYHIIGTEQLRWLLRGTMCRLMLINHILIRIWSNAPYHTFVCSNVYLLGLPTLRQDMLPDSREPSANRRLGSKGKFQIFSASEVVVGSSLCIRCTCDGAHLDTSIHVSSIAA